MVRKLAHDRVIKSCNMVAIFKFCVLETRIDKHEPFALMLTILDGSNANTMSKLSGCI
jgi:hypothetical protein